MTLGLIRRPERGLAPLGDRKPGVCSQRLLSAKKVGRAGDHPLALNIAERCGAVRSARGEGIVSTRLVSVLGVLRIRLRGYPAYLNLFKPATRSLTRS